MLAKRLSVILAILIVLPTLAVGWIAYSSWIEGIRTEQIKIVGRVADAKHSELVTVLTKLNGRAKALLSATTAQCGNAAKLDLPCAKKEISEFLKIEGARGAILHRRNAEEDLAVGAPLAGIDEIPDTGAGQLALFTRHAHGAERSFIVVATTPETGFQLVVTYPVSFLQPLFAPPQDLHKSGEVFLTDNEGFFITNAKYPSEQGNSHPISARPMQLCLSGKNGEVLDLDYRDVPVIHGFRLIPEVGGGCIMAHIDQAEVFAPLQTMKKQLAAAMLFFIVIAVIAANYLARFIVKPITRLTNVARDIKKGDYAVRAVVEGHDEISELASTFNKMTEQLVTVNKRLNKKVGESTQSLRVMATAFEHSGEGILVTDAENNIIAVNEAFYTMTGYTQEDVLGKKLGAGKETNELFQQIWSSLKDKGSWQGEILDHRKNGQVYPQRLSITAVRDEQNRITNYIGNFSDITEQKAYEEKIRYLAHHDTLTSLPNRFTLVDRLEQAISSAQRNKEKVAVMFIDLDRFKSINDTLGHNIGDQLLIQVAQRLQSCVRNSDIVARLGGDEFVVALVEIEGVERVFHVADNILRTLGQTYFVEEYALYSSPSIGIAFFPEDGETVEEVMKNADVAMYHAKSKGRNNYQFFEQAMNTASLERMELENDMRLALEREEFLLHYQPQINIITGQVVGVEALVRWQHTKKGLVFPATFIPIAEDTGLIFPLGEWILRTACHQLKQWLGHGMTEMQMCVKLSLRQFRQKDLHVKIASIVAEEKIDPALLELEIPESVAMSNPQEAVDIMQMLRSIGVTLAIDDFGKSHSSLSYLKQFPINRLKLDYSFIKNIETDPKDAAIYAATVTLANHLGLDVVAKGVETEKQHDYLKQLNCNKIQGYYCSKPLPAKEAEVIFLSEIRAGKPYAVFSGNKERDMNTHIATDSSVAGNV